MSRYEPADYTSDDEERKRKMPEICSLYMVTHLIISFFAIYLSWRCNKGYNTMSFLVALLCPYLYIIWALATKGGCGIFNQSNFDNLSALSPTSSQYM